MAFFQGAAQEAQRAMNLIKKREREQEEMERKKKKIENELEIGNITNKFAAHYDAIEQKLKSDTIGLVTLDEMKARQDSVIRERENQLAAADAAARLAEEKTKKFKKTHDKKKKAALSFAMDEDDDPDAEADEEEAEKNEKPGTSVLKQTEEPSSTQQEEGETKKRKRLGKDPTVDTSFLPDRDREEEDAKMREQLKKEWQEKQQAIKQEEIMITYSYWDGSGHRRQVRMKKGNSIQQFLQRCLEQLRKDFLELRAASVDQLMYVKEDIIIPQHFTFYDFIVTRARGKSGALFNFDVYDDVRIRADASREKDESHAGKVCLRAWYERNKHIFPASRWEPYDATKQWDKYSVSDKESAKIIVK